MTFSPWRRRTAVAAAAAVATAGLLIPAAAADPATDPDLLLHYDFSTPGAVTDVSGNGNDGALLGTGATIADGELRLPGGSASSGAGHVRLPDGVFDGQDTLTISTWLQNETANGNYAAMFFGSAANPPSQYWLLNPANPAGRVKSVMTGAAAPAPGAPWGTEYGISASNAAQGVTGPARTDDWAMYTTVITPTSITGYLNGTSLGTVAVNRSVTQFGTDLVGYIGRSSYPDIYFRGGVDDVIVSASAYDADAVAELFHGSDRAEALTLATLNADADAITLPTATGSNLTLPTSSASGADVVWTSSDEARVRPDGSVTRPAAGEPDAVVDLTATLTLGGRSVEREFQVTVYAVSATGDLARSAAAFDLGITVVADDLVLRDETLDGSADIAWTSSSTGVVAADGTVTRGAQDSTVTLTAAFTSPEAPGALETRAFDVTVLAADAGTLAAYVKAGDTDRTDVLHLAAATGDEDYVALNNDKGIRYPTYGLGSFRFGNPVLFRHPDGTFGFLATDNNASARVFVYDSADLITYDNERLATTNTLGHTVARASVRYDNGILAYRVTYTTPAGESYEVTTADFATFSAPASTTTPAAPAVAGLPAGAAEASELAVTQDVYDAVVAKLGRITNTGISGFEDVTLPVDGELTLPQDVDLSYSDGSTKQLGVEWDTSDVDLNRPGTYEVTGEVQQPVYGDEDGILVRERADPWVLRDDERTGDTEYYLTGSYPTTQANAGVGYDRIVLRRADDINGLTTAQEQVLLYANNTSAQVTKEPGVRTAASHFRYFWAPEFHKIGGDWYILFTASRSNDVWNIRPAIMKADGEDDPMDPASWGEPQFMQSFQGDPNAFTSFSLDMTYFEANGKHYVSWAEKPGTSDLRLAEIDPANPQQLTSRSILLSTPNYAWERSSGNVINEGAAVISDENNVFVFFSAASVDENYSIGVLSAPIDGDLMDPATWTKAGYPLLTSGDFDGQQTGTGHNSFTLDADGNPVIVYHARPAREEWAPGADGGLNDPSRHARVKTVHFAADGQAVLNQTREEELAPANREVSLTVTVQEEPVVPVFADVPEGTMFFEQIQWLAERGISRGWDMPDGTKQYRPLTPVARDAMAAFLYRLAQEPEFDAPAVSPFTDVRPTDEHYKEIAWLHETGISTGWANGDGTYSYRPLAPIARDAMAAFLHRYAQGEGLIETGWTPPTTSPFSDVTTTNPYYTEIAWMHHTGIATGWKGHGNDGTDIYQPLNPVNRDAMAAFMNRLHHHTPTT